MSKNQKSKTFDGKLMMPFSIMLNELVKRLPRDFAEEIVVEVVDDDDLVDIRKIAKTMVKKSVPDSLTRQFSSEVELYWRCYNKQ